MGSARPYPDSRGSQLGVATWLPPHRRRDVRWHRYKYPPEEVSALLAKTAIRGPTSRVSVYFKGCSQTRQARGCAQTHPKGCSQTRQAKGSSQAATRSWGHIWGYFL